MPRPFSRSGTSRSAVIAAMVEACETGGSPRYQMDTENPAAKKLAELEWELVDLAFEEE